MRGNRTQPGRGQSIIRLLLEVKSTNLTRTTLYRLPGEVGRIYIRTFAGSFRVQPQRDLLSTSLVAMYSMIFHTQIPHIGATRGPLL